MERILRQLSEAIVTTINGTRTPREFISDILQDLTRLETRPGYLTEIAYGWCSVICENRRSLRDWGSLLLACLEVGFRHLDLQSPSIKATLSHTEHHRKLVDVVFKSRKNEVIGDLLHAWTTGGYFFVPAYGLLGSCTEHLVGLHNLVPSSPRLRRLVIRSVELIGYKGFEGVDRFIQLLNHLHVTVKDMDTKHVWARLLLDILKSSAGVQHLSQWYWELLVELSISVSRRLRHGFRVTYSPQITTFLIKAQEWGKLECWMGIVWILWPPDADGIVGEDLERLMPLLFRQRPGAAQKFEGWIERWSQECGEDVPESFHRICEQAHEAAQRGAS